MKNAGLIVIVALVLLVGAWAGPAAAQPGQFGLHFDPLAIDVGFSIIPALFGSAYHHDLTKDFLDTWIWLGVVSNDAFVHVQFYDEKCARTNDYEQEMTAGETTLLFTSDIVPDAQAGVFLVEGICEGIFDEDGPSSFLGCALIGEIWHLNLDDGILFSRSLYTNHPISLTWSFFDTEHWDIIAQGFNTFATNLWLNCPTGKDGKGTSGNTALYDDLRFGRVIDIPAAFCGGDPACGRLLGPLDLVDLLNGPPSNPPFSGLPGASLADFLLINFDESPGGSRDDLPCPCLRDGPIETFSGLFHDFFGQLRVRFKTAANAPALGLVHKTGGVPGLQVFDKRFHPLAPFAFEPTGVSPQ